MKITEIAKPHKIAILNLFENRAQYNQMLAGLVKTGVISNSDATKYIDLFRKTLKRNDRIVWALHWFRLSSIMNNMENLDEDQIPALKQYYKKLTKGRDLQTDFDNMHNFSLFATFISDFQYQPQLEHLSYSLEEIPSIGNIQWNIDITPIQMKQTIINLEREWQENRRRFITPEPSDEIILSYNNGKYGWVLLSREYCETEGNAMGHCGNKPSASPGDRILSFRSIETSQQKPHLTFILHGDGMLGEMKGFANNKPDEKYHPYIVDLLKQDFISGISGGGYAPKNNFEMSDLPANIRDDLLELKPALGGSLYMWELNNREYSPEIGEVLSKEIANEYGSYVDFDLQSGLITVVTYSDITEIGNEIDDNDLAEVGYYINGTSVPDVDVREEMISEQIPRIMKRLPQNIQDSIYKYLDKAGVLDEYSITRSVINEYDQIYSSFERGIQHGAEIGYINLLEDTVNSWMDDNNIEPIFSGTRNRFSEILPKYDPALTDKYMLTISANDLLKWCKFSYMSPSEIDQVQEAIDFTHYEIPDIEGFDDDSAIQTTLEALKEIPELR